METTALETHNDLPAFVPEKELKTALTAAQQVARQRDELASENARLRREVETSARSQRQLEEATAGGDGLSKRLRLLREALVRKDQEILNLKSYQQGHAKQLIEAREVADRLRRERASLEERLRTRDGAFVAIERERENLTRALDGARRDGERAAQVVMQVDSTMGEWRAAYEAATRELEEARRQLAEVRTAWQSLAQDRQRQAEAHAAEISTVRSETAAALERLRREMEDCLTEATARYDAAREAHAIALRATEDDHASELDEEHDARTALEEDLSATRAQLARAESTRNWADGELAAVRARLEAAEAALDATVRDLQETHTDEIERLTDGHQVETQNLVAAFEAELNVLRALSGNGDLSRQLPRDLRELGEAYADAEGRARALSAEVEDARARIAKNDATLAEVTREREEARCALVDLLADNDARNAGAVREVKEQHGEALREAELRYSQALDEAQRYFNEALGAQRESHESEILSLRDSLTGDEARVRDLERDLQSAREALGNYAAESAERLLVAERTADEALGARERYARKLIAAGKRIKALERGGAPEGATASTSDLGDASVQVAGLTRIVGEVMSTAVLHLSGASAFKAGRRKPEMTDIEEAISLVGDGLPENVCELLWNARESFYHRAIALPGVR